MNITLEEIGNFRNCIFCNKKMKIFFHVFDNKNYINPIKYHFYDYDINYYCLKSKHKLLFINKKTLEINPNNNASIFMIDIRCMTCPYDFIARTTNNSKFYLDTTCISIYMNNKIIDIDQYSNTKRGAVTYMHIFDKDKNNFSYLEFKFHLIKLDMNKNKIKKLIRSVLTFN